MGKSYERVVIGGGVNGLCSAWALIKRGVKSLAVLESHVVGGDQGSSHGHSRITRSAYADPLYVRLMQKAHNSHWLQLQSDLNTDLKIPCTGIVWGPSNGVFHHYADAVIQAGAAVELLERSDARRRYPQFDFTAADGVLEDHTAGIIASSATIRGLRDFLLAHGVDIYEGCQVQSIDPAPTDIRLATNRGSFTAQRIIACAGPWMSRLFPILESKLKVTLQKVFFWNLVDVEQERPGKLPVWVALGLNPVDTWYGLPSFGRPGIKVAHHRLVGNDDPDQDAWVDEFDLGSVKRKMAELFRLQIRDLSGWASCKYTVTEHEDFILTHHPEDNRIVLGAGFSGHGFKFGPLTGDALASLCETGGFLEDEMIRNQHRFQL